MEGLISYHRDDDNIQNPVSPNPGNTMALTVYGLSTFGTMPVGRMGIR